MPYSIDIKNKAIYLRQKGFSLKEVSEKLHIAKSTSSLWLRDVKLNQVALKRLKNRKIIGQYKTIQIKKNKRLLMLANFDKEANKNLTSFVFEKKHYQLLCALLYWCEGAKFTDTRIEFTNSDPKLIKVFLLLLRKGFNINNKKLRINMHLHKYHDEKLQKKYWSKITGINLTQFNKAYLKPNTQRNIRKGYPGCVRICYYSAETARKIKAIYTNLDKYL